jgi:hypothetical protein
MPNARALPEIPAALAEEASRCSTRPCVTCPTPMRRGLDRHDGRLRPGKLFSAEGGCAVGVMLRELYPS